ncbi:hypothetical protein [Listeria phage List-36]|uniref:Bacterial Ig domain-containing protein n=1 Tax=Listeria phage List-36 TaxID=1486422 RepID=A0A060AFC0_9CAUD|nr:virion structural protein [Listeria phage List-36]AIA64241.1 hypothetical protein [Listeria phage List-36]
MPNFLKNIHPLLKRKKDDNQVSSVNYAVLQALETELSEVEQETLESKVQSSLGTATGDYLDIWGDWFNVYRREDEGDERYRDRIIRHLLLKRGTIPAIIEAIRDFLEDYSADITIYEPFKNIFYTNKSDLNGEDYLMGYYYRFAIIDVTIGRRFPLEVIDIINAFKPAGVKFYLTYDGSGEIDEENSIVELPPYSIEIETYQDVDILNGLNTTLHGHFTLGESNIVEGVILELFRTNRSPLNSNDVLSGSFNAGRRVYNLATIGDNSYKPTMSSLIGEIKNSFEELPEDFYVETNRLDDRFASIDMANNTQDTAFYFNMDLGTYINSNYAGYLAELAGSQIINRAHYVSLAKEPKLTVAFKAKISPANPVNYNIEGYDLVSKKWVVLETGAIAVEKKISQIPLGSLEDYLNSNYICFFRIVVKPKRETYSFELDYFELGFLNNFKEGEYTIKPFTGIVETYAELFGRVIEVPMYRIINSGTENIISKQGHIPVRYIRDTLEGGSTTNTANLWIEIQAKNKDNINVALNKPVYRPQAEPTNGNILLYPQFLNVGATYMNGKWRGKLTSGVNMAYTVDGVRTYGGNMNADGTYTVYIGNKVTSTSQKVVVEVYADTARTKLIDKASVPITNAGGGSPIEAITDGVISGSNEFYIAPTSAKYSVTVDLEATFVDLSEVRIWHYPTRTFKSVLTEVSADGINWTTIYNSAVDGTYLETSEGKAFPVPEMDLYGLKATPLTSVLAGSERQIVTFLDYKIEDFENPANTIENLNNDYFNAVWQDIDQLEEFVLGKFTILADVGSDGVLVNDWGLIEAKIPTGATAYQEADSRSELSSVYTVELTAGSHEVIMDVASKVVTTETVTLKTDYRVSNELTLEGLPTKIPVRYIRDSLWGGNSINTANHWVELQARDLKGDNVALNKKVVENNGVSLLSPENLMLESKTEITSATNNGYTFASDIAYIFDNYGVDKEYTISFDIKSTTVGTVTVYSRYKDEAKYSIGNKTVPVTTAYTRQQVVVTPTRNTAEQAKYAVSSILGFLNSTGAISTVKDIKISVGNISNMIWTPAPKDYSILTDGVTTSANGFLSGVNSLTIDLGSPRYDIDNITMWHYWQGAEPRYYKYVKLEVSADGVNWTTLFDSDVSGTYYETSGGKQVSVPAIKEYLKSTNAIFAPSVAGTGTFEKVTEANGVSSIKVTPDTDKTVRMYKFFGTSTDPNANSRDLLESGLTTTKKYTVAVSLKPQNNSSVILAVKDGSNTNIESGSLNIAKDVWTRVSYNVTLPATAIDRLALCLYNANTGEYINYKDWSIKETMFP